MKFNNIKELVNHCNTSIHRIQYLKAKRYITIDKKIGDQYNGHYEISQETIDIIIKMRDMDRQDLADMTSMRDYGCLNRGGWKWSTKTNDYDWQKRNESGAGFIKALERQQKELASQ